MYLIDAVIQAGKYEASVRKSRTDASPNGIHLAALQTGCLSNSSRDDWACSHHHANYLHWLCSQLCSNLYMMPKRHCPAVHGKHVTSRVTCTLPIPMKPVAAAATHATSERIRTHARNKNSWATLLADTAECKGAVLDELQDMEDDRIWELVPLPPGISFSRLENGKPVHVLSCTLSVKHPVECTYSNEILCVTACFSPLTLPQEAFGIQQVCHQRAARFR